MAAVLLRFNMSLSWVGVLGCFTDECRERTFLRASPRVLKPALNVLKPRGTIGKRLPGTPGEVADPGCKEQGAGDLEQTYRFGTVEVRPAERQILVERRPAPVGAPPFDL